MSPPNRYQLLPHSALPSFPIFGRKKHHSLASIPRVLLILSLCVPVIVITWVFYKLALVSNAFRTYETNPPVFIEPFKGKGKEVESSVPVFPSWVTSQMNSPDTILWNVKKELSRRYIEIGLPDLTVGCPAIRSLRSDESGYLEQRYSHLFPETATNPTSPYIHQPQGYFIALNLFNSKAVIPHLFSTLLTVAGLLGPSNVHVAIFENGSWDGTPTLLAHFARALSALGVAHTIRSDSHVTDWNNVDRIAQLAEYRNVALEPVFNYSPSNPPLFQAHKETNLTRHPILPSDVLFINDIILCPADLLELLHQRRFQGASATCGLDWREAPEGSMWRWLRGWLSKNYRFYDNWVTRSMEGFPLRPRVDMFGELRDGVRELFHWDSDPTYLIRWRAAIPLPVYSCWNGIIALSARPFLPPAQGGHSFKFRNGHTADGECAASECKLIARDFWGVGETKWVLVPRVAVTYEEEGYKSEWIENRVRRGGVPGMDKDLKDRRFRHAPSTAMPLEEKIDWSMVKNPERVVCFPYHVGDRLEIWPLYQEGSSMNSSILHDFNRTSAHVPWEDII